MHNHTIALALADARVADVQRAGTHTTAAAPQRHRRRASALLGLAATAAVAAPAPTGALAQPTHDLRALAKTSSLAGTSAPSRQVVTVRTARGLDPSPNQTDAANHALAMRSQGLEQHRYGDGRPAVASSGQPAPVTTVRDSRGPSGGIDWADAALGAGSLLGISLLALGGTLFITHRRRAAHATPPVAGL